MGAALNPVPRMRMAKKNETHQYAANPRRPRSVRRSSALRLALIVPKRAATPSGVSTQEIETVRTVPRAKAQGTRSRAQRPQPIRLPTPRSYQSASGSASLAVAARAGLQ